MNQWLNKRVKIHIRKEGTDLFYHATVTEVTPEHLSFLDRYGKAYTFHRSHIMQVSEE